MIGGEMIHWVLHRFGIQLARTQTSAGERAALQEFATGCHRIVELGVFEGVTTRLMRQAMSPDGEIWCVDPFTPGKLGVSWTRGIAHREIARSTVGKAVYVRQTSQEAVNRYSDSIDFLFIDADHAYDAVRKDWDDWKRFVRVGGRIALHDSRPVPGFEYAGPIRLADEVRQHEADFTVLRVVDTLTVFERIR